MNPIGGDCCANVAMRCRRVDTVPSFEALAMLPSSASFPPASPSLPRVPAVRVSLAQRYYETLRPPTAPHAALRCLRLALPRSRA